MDVMQHSPKPIVAYMKRYGLTQSQFAELVGASQSAVSQWLQGKTRISVRRGKLIEERTGGGVRKSKLFPKLFGRGA